VGGALGVANRALEAGFIDVDAHGRLVTAAGDAFLKGSSAAFFVAAGVAVFTAVVVGRYLPVGSTAVPVAAVPGAGGEAVAGSGRPVVGAVDDERPDPSDDVLSPPPVPID
jgi:hypothetical protein